MQVAQLLDYVAAEHRDEVRRIYGTFVKAIGVRAEDKIDSFASALHARGLLSEEGLKDFLTYHELTIGTLDPATGQPAAILYERMALLGQGAMGEVYLARDPSLKRTVAVKQVHAELTDDPLLMQRFFNEAQVTAQLEHPAIVPVYGLERDASGVLSYAMKFVRGQTLTDYLDAAREQVRLRGKPDASHALKVRVETFIPVLNALAYAHRRGVMHRDLKPDNIMVGSFGEVLVMDWGIARVRGQGEPESPPRSDTAPVSPAAAQPLPAPATHTNLTLAGSLLGTPAYMSPEQAAGRELDAASDQYALGLILQEIATLEQALVADSMALMVARALRGERRPMTDGAEPVARELRAIVARATAPQARDRYPSVEALAEDLRRFLRDESVEADPDRGVRKLTRWIANHRGLAVSLAAAASLLGFAVVVLFIWQGQVALADEREAARAYERQMMGLEAMVDAQGSRMRERLNRYEALLEGIASTSSLVLREPAPPSGVAVYQYAGGRRVPEAAPSYAVPSKAYQQPASLRADYAAAWGLDPRAHSAAFDQLARIEPVLRNALLRSISEATAELPFADAERLVLDEGAPLLWTYLHTADGLAVGVPGSWRYDDSKGGTGYDHRREGWYTSALDTRGPAWTVSADENGLGLTVNCVQTVRDAQGKVLAVAGVDIWLNRFIAELLEPPALARVGADAVLLDREARVMVRASAKEAARALTDYAPVMYEEPGVVAMLKSTPSGHLALPGGRVAVWTSLGSAGLTYLVVGPEAALLAASAR